MESISKNWFQQSMICLIDLPDSTLANYSEHHSFWGCMAFNGVGQPLIVWEDLSVNKEMVYGSQVSICANFVDFSKIHTGLPFYCKPVLVIIAGLKSG